MASSIIEQVRSRDRTNIMHVLPIGCCEVKLVDVVDDGFAGDPDGGAVQSPDPGGQSLESEAKVAHPCKVSFNLIACLDHGPSGGCLMEAQGECLGP